MIGSAESRTRMTCSMLLMAATLLASACGGGGDTTPYEDAIAEANARESEARILGVGNPCSEAAQCASLAFLSPSTDCAVWTYKPYSLTSPTAVAAGAAAIAQNDSAAAARTLAPHQSSPCLGRIGAPPVLMCSANLCMAVPPPSRSL